MEKKIVVECLVYAQGYKAINYFLSRRFDNIDKHEILHVSQ